MLLLKIKKNPILSSRSLESELRKETSKFVHSETVRRQIRNVGYHGSIAKRKPFIIEVNMEVLIET